MTSREIRQWLTPMRDHDVSTMTADELEHARRELAASLALLRPGSPARVPIDNQLRAIDAACNQRGLAP
jgi:hypothetical protein